MPSHPTAMKPCNLLLVGGGHAHVAVLADWISRGAPEGARGVLLTPERYLRYSGMVPGWLVGHHARDDGLVDLAALAQRAGVELVLGTCTAIDPAARVVRMVGGASIAFDLASIDTGGVGRARALLGDDPRLIDVRPISAFVDRVAALPALGRVVVAGGGAGGVELAFGLRNHARGGAGPQPEVTLVTGEGGLLPGFADAVRRKAALALARQGIVAVAGRMALERGTVIAGGASLEPVSTIIAALGSAAPNWARASGLACDAACFITVNQHQQSVSHPHIFAAGDVAARSDRPLPHSGVHAVFAGPVLAANLRAALAGEAPDRAYRPRWNNLYLLDTGDGSAIASYGRLAAQGRWVLRLKHGIDRRWIARYAALAGRA
ncbi:MAG: FAD-dependent oxidoreductase [Erythrobacter sp.]